MQRDIAHKINSCSDKSNVYNLCNSKLSFNDRQIHKLRKGNLASVKFSNLVVTEKRWFTASRFQEVDLKNASYE